MFRWDPLLIPVIFLWDPHHIQAWEVRVLAWGQEDQVQDIRAWEDQAQDTQGWEDQVQDILEWVDQVQATQG